MTPAIIAADHPALKNYYDTLSTLGNLGKTKEQSTRRAFSALLDSLSRPVGWTLVEEETLANGKRLDGALLDEWKFPRGHWEAKDIHDDLDVDFLIG